MPYVRPSRRRPDWMKLVDRLPWEPLEVVLRGRVTDAATDDLEPTDRRMGDEIGVARTEIVAFRTRGWLTASHGDLFATRLGLTPHAIWGDAWDAHIPIEDEDMIA